MTASQAPWAPFNEQHMLVGCEVLTVTEFGREKIKTSTNIEKLMQLEREGKLGGVVNDLNEIGIIPEGHSDGTFASIFIKNWSKRDTDFIREYGYTGGYIMPTCSAKYMIYGLYDADKFEHEHGHDDVIAFLERIAENRGDTGSTE